MITKQHLVSDSYRQTEHGLDCNYFGRATNACWGQVRYFSLLNSGRVVCLCEGHRSVYQYGEYVGQYTPEKENSYG